MTLSRAELQDAARKAFEGELAPEATASWSRIADMGFLMMAVPEALGGLGLGNEAAAAIHTELGRALVPGPAIAQMLVIEGLATADPSSDRDDLLARAMSGEVMTVSLTGDHHCVPDADRASHLLLLDEARITLVPLTADQASQRDTWDKTRRLFDIAPERTGLVLAEGEAGKALTDRLQSQLLLALAADSLGGADAILDLTVDYLKTRRQFDRPLAMFQALKHRVADLKTRLSAAEALLWTRAAGSATLTEMGALKAHACTVYRAIAEDAIQLHGGIGLTMEYHCHLFLKRAMLNAALGGDADHWDERAGRAALTAA